MSEQKQIDPDTGWSVGYVGQPGGFLFNLLEPEQHSNGKHKLNLLDMCRALGNTHRFNGNTKSNTAWHSMMVANRAMELAGCAGKPALIRKRVYKLGLIHDLHEALTGDISRPFKGACPAVKEVEAKVEAWLHAELGFTGMQGNSYVKQADQDVGDWEYREFMVMRRDARLYCTDHDGDDLYEALRDLNIDFLQNLIKEQACLPT